MHHASFQFNSQLNHWNSITQTLPLTPMFKWSNTFFTKRLRRVKETYTLSPIRFPCLTCSIQDIHSFTKHFNTRPGWIRSKDRLTSLSNWLIEAFYLFIEIRPWSVQRTHHCETNHSGLNTYIILRYIKDSRSANVWQLNGF